MGVKQGASVAPVSPAGTGPTRRLSFVDCLGIAVNGVVGSGVFFLLAPLAATAGRASVLGIVVCGAVCSLIALCFVELAGMFDANGGTYVYVKEAFGRGVGFPVAWISGCTGVLVYAAVATAFAQSLLPLVVSPSVLASWPPWLAARAPGAVAACLVLALGAVNVAGVKAGARTGDVLSAAKLAPLLALAAFGLWAVPGEVLREAFWPRTGEWDQVFSAAFLAVFMLSGFEFTAVPSGEAAHARRNVPLAMIATLLGASVLYAALQLVALSVVPDLAQRSSPLADAAGALGGGWARGAVLVGALVSAGGFCASSALVVPRYVTTLAEEGFLPSALAARGERGTPVRAIVLVSALAALAALFSGYAQLVDVSTLAMFGQYVPATLAVLALRRRRPDAPRRYRLPLGPAIPLAAAASCAALLWRAAPARREWLTGAVVLAAGYLAWALTAQLKARSAVERDRPGLPG